MLSFQMYNDARVPTIDNPLFHGCHSSFFHNLKEQFQKRNSLQIGLLIEESTSFAMFGNQEVLFQVFN